MSQCASLLSAAANAASRTTRTAGVSGIELMYSCRTASSTCESAGPTPQGRQQGVAHAARGGGRASRALEDSEDVGRVLVSPLAESTGERGACSWSSDAGLTRSLGKRAALGAGADTVGVGGSLIFVTTGRSF